ncbi:hypothetical protein DEV91_12479 [Phyllobacterium brassicacearum]|nr:hypothetical protein DEV91_12479 [Phyllobacterium brassicacearum]
MRSLSLHGLSAMGRGFPAAGAAPFDAITAIATFKDSIEACQAMADEFRRAVQQATRS